MITIAVQVHNFQHRFSWMLSSIAHQIDGPEITVDVSCAKDAGTPTTEQIAALYPDLNVNLHYYPLEQLQYRGLTRNNVIERCQTEWLLFADCDMVYHPEYFARLVKQIESNDTKRDHMLIAGRYSNDIDKANALVQAESYDAAIPNPWKRVDARLNKIKRGNVGAGYFQLISMADFAHGGYYVDPESNCDQAWLSKWAKANSDHQFRRRVGKVQRLPRWFNQSQIHINHNRDNMFKRHLDEQR